MSELARRRSARDLWVSRSHIGAAVAGAALVAISSYAIGYMVGVSAVPTVSVEPSLLAEAPDEALVDLLARIDANAERSEGHLTFPEVLRGEAVGPMAPLGALTSEAIVTTFDAGAPLPRVGPPPASGRFTLVVESASELATLGDAGSDGWLSMSVVAGELRYSLNVGAFDDESEATAYSAENVERWEEPPLVRPILR
jgi:hypothetical protein